MLSVRDGNIDDLDELFNRHHVTVYNYFLRLTRCRAGSEDLTQEVFLRILRFRHTYHGKGSFVAWMFQIARNVGIDFFRKNKHNSTWDDQYNEIESKDPSPLDHVSHNQEIELLHQALQRLPMKHRELIVLSRFEHLSVKEMAQLFKCPVNTIKVRIHRAIKELSTIYYQLVRVT